jgi:hypothetical protein
MPNKRLLAVLTALILASGAPSVNASYTFSDLVEIERLLLEGDWRGLRAHLLRTPALLEGDHPLAAELRDFVASVDGGALGFLATAPELPDIATVQSLQDSY